jgi:hypothetical protein
MFVHFESFSTWFLISLRSSHELFKENIAGPNVAGKELSLESECSGSSCRRQASIIREQMSQEEMFGEQVSRGQLFEVHLSWNYPKSIEHFLRNEQKHHLA